MLSAVMPMSMTPPLPAPAAPCNNQGTSTCCWHYGRPARPLATLSIARQPPAVSTARLQCRPNAQSDAEGHPRPCRRPPKSEFAPGVGIGCGLRQPPPMGTLWSTPAARPARAPTPCPGGETVQWAVPAWLPHGSALNHAPPQARRR